ncbi:MAG: GyrI-like domain-containing protein [Methanobrevibacter sp.]|uniref:GyrI-like domain-containing protein n=1 Tax=Methanobrevibacter sp. TaxID=66852 RepID=UPI0026DF93E2|nr:GyrI-like domain-containing protein [Methanobrevibacter sp.]MDO5848208.1 GyrI-like domain-containing protein [Methanobrevibacter sp.]
MQCEEKHIPDQKLAVINYKGPIEDMDVLVAKLMGWVEEEEIDVKGEPFIIYYSPRHEVGNGEDVVFDVGIVLGDDEDPEKTDLIRIVDLFEHNVLAGIHEGDTSSIMDTYEKIVDYSVNNGYEIIGSPTEILIKSKYNADDVDNYITEIQVPIIKI